MDRYEVIVADVGARNQNLKFTPTTRYVVVAADGREMFREHGLYLIRARELCDELNRAFADGQRANAEPVY